jgi:hypothetical protein
LNVNAASPRYQYARRRLVCRAATADSVPQATLEPSEPAAVIRQLERTLILARMHSKQMQYQSPTTAGPLNWSAALQLLTASHRPTLQPVEPAVFNRQIEIMLTAAEMRKERAQERFATLPLLSDEHVRKTAGAE